MATFVLVHGSTAGGWCWAKVTPAMRAAGHEVYTPTLTGLGERVHLLTPNVSLTTHIEDIVNVLFYEDVRDVILVGWSYGGMVITGVAEHAADRLSHLVYLDAFMPYDGECAFELIPQIGERWLAEAIDSNGVRARAPFSRDFMRNAWHIHDPDDLTWMEDRLTPMPLATHEDPIQLPSNRAADLPRSFIYCARGTLEALATRARHLGVDYHELQTQHAPMVTMPQELAALLIQIADDSASRQRDTS